MGKSTECVLTAVRDAMSAVQGGGGMSIGCTVPFTPFPHLWSRSSRAHMAAAQLTSSGPRWWLSSHEASGAEAVAALAEEAGQPVSAVVAPRKWATTASVVRCSTASCAPDVSRVGWYAPVSCFPMGGRGEEQEEESGSDELR